MAVLRGAHDEPTLRTHPGSRHTQPRPAAPLAIVAVQYRVPMASCASRGWGQAGHATSVSSRSRGVVVRTVVLCVSGADVMSVLPSPDGKFVQCGPESRTTRAWPPTCEMLSTPPTLRTAETDGRLAGDVRAAVRRAGQRAEAMELRQHSSVSPTLRPPLPDLRAVSGSDVRGFGTPPSPDRAQPSTAGRARARCRGRLQDSTVAPDRW